MIIKIVSSFILFFNFKILAQEYNYLKPSRDGIGKFYLDREISKVMGHLGASWLERNTREKEENSKLLVKNLNLNKEMVVADIGAGTGYYTSRMAKLSKLVYAVEIQQEMYSALQKDAAVVLELTPNARQSLPKPLLTPVRFRLACQNHDRQQMDLLVSRPSPWCIHFATETTA